MVVIYVLYQVSRLNSTTVKPLPVSRPFNVTFTNQSSGPGNMTFQWDLANGSNSTQSNPSTTYASNGTYNVTLTATSEFGCSGTITKPVVLNGPNTVINVPNVVCQNATIPFVNGGSVTPLKTLWDFGNGVTSTNTNDNTVYTSPGTVTVKLRNTYAGCVDSVTKNIVVQPAPTIDFTATNAAACKAPLQCYLSGCICNSYDKMELGFW